MEGLKLQLAAFISIREPAILDEAVQYATAIEVGEFYRKGRISTLKERKVEDELDIVTEQLRKLSINYANLTSALAAGVEVRKNQ